MNYGACPIGLQRLQSSVGSVVDLSTFSSRTEFAIQLPPHTVPDRLILSLELEWVPGALTQSGLVIPFVILPDFLPRPVGRGVKPLPRIEIENRAVDVSVHRVSPITGGEHAVQIGLLAASDWGLQSCEGVPVLTDPVLRGSWRHAPTVVKVARDCQRFLATLFGRDCLGEISIIAIGDDRRLPNPNSMMVTADPSFLGLESGDTGILATFGVAFLAALWWGVCIRVPGLVGAGICHGIGQWSGRERARLECEDDHAAMLEETLRLAADEPLTDDLNQLNRRFAAHVALTLPRADSRRSGWLRDLTQKHWGLETQTDSVLHDLSKAGIELSVPRILSEADA